LLLAAVGWVVFFFMFRTENAVEPEALEEAVETGRADSRIDEAEGPATT
jgi:hypothetical protein